MLFDLKGRRKRAVQVTYVILAVLFGGGLIFFGVGSSVQGGLLDAFKGGGGGSGSSGVFENQAKRYERLTRINPESQQAWLGLARAQYNVAVSGKDYDRNVGQFSEGAVDTLQRGANAWERYLELKPGKPDAAVAAVMIPAYATLLRFESGDPLDLFEKAARTQEIIVKARPSPITYFQLAAINYAIGKIPKGDRAAKKALHLTPKDQRNTVSSQLKDVRKQGVKAKKQLKKSAQQAAAAARKARKSGQDPFGATPGQSSLGGQ
jgi:tetratricopeptide (TPR) repeat protein